MSAGIPTFCARADRTLAAAAGRARLLAAVAPRETDDERARVIAALEAGRDATPRWTYEPAHHEELVRGLTEMTAELEALSADEPLAALYARRAAEIALEARLAERAGTAAFPGLARVRFHEVPEDAARAEALARDWGSDLIDAGAADHIHTAAGYGPWPEGLARFEAFLERLAGG